MEQISWSDFEKIELRVGTVVAAEDFPEARKPAYKITADFGEFGVKKSSVQITQLYKREDLIGRQIVGVINFPPKKLDHSLQSFLRQDFLMRMALLFLHSRNGKYRTVQKFSSFSWG